VADDDSEIDAPMVELLHLRDRYARPTNIRRGRTRSALYGCTTSRK